MLIVAAIIEEEGRFLLARRAPHKQDAGYWEFPGGKVEPRETPQRALARELMEEMEVETTIGHLFHEANCDGLDFQAYRAKIMVGRPCLKDHDSLAWVAPGQFGPYSMHSFDQEVASLLGKPTA